VVVVQENPEQTENPQPHLVALIQFFLPSLLQVEVEEVI
jgi:hypothetical protein